MSLVSAPAKKLMRRKKPRSFELTSKVSFVTPMTAYEPAVTRFTLKR